MTNGMKWMGARCPSCGCNACPKSCGCQLSSLITWDNVNAPSQLKISDLIVPSSYRFWTAEYNDACNDCPAEFDPSDPFAGGPPVKVTPTSKTDYKTFGEYVLDRTGNGSAGYGCHRYEATITDVPNASTKDDLWGNYITGAAPSGVLGSNNVSVSISTSGKYPLGADHGVTQGTAVLFDGLRKIEYDTDDTLNSNRGLLTLYPEYVWTPLSSRRWETSFAANNNDGWCWGLTSGDAAVLGLTSSGVMAVPLDERYWDGTFQKDHWQSTNLSGVPFFQMSLANTTGANGFSSSLGTDQTISNTQSNSIKMPRGTSFIDFLCNDFSTINADADWVTTSGTETASATAQTRLGSYCVCWSNPDGEGCLPFPQNGTQPLVSDWVTSLVLTIGGTTYTQNANCTTSAGNLSITVPTDNGNVVLTRCPLGSGSGRKIYINNNVFTLNACTGSVTGSQDAGSGSLTMTWAHGEECTDCPDLL